MALKTAPQESSAQQLSFEWSHTRVLSTLSLKSSENHLVQHNTQYHMKVLLNSFHLNGLTLGFDPQTKKLEPVAAAGKIVTPWPVASAGKVTECKQGFTSEYEDNTSLGARYVKVWINYFYVTVTRAVINAFLTGGRQMCCNPGLTITFPNFRHFPGLSRIFAAHQSPHWSHPELF